MAKRLTDFERKQIIADYVEIGSYNAVAKKHGISLNTVKNIVISAENAENADNAEFAEMCKQKKQENAESILEHMAEKRDKVCLIIDRYLDRLLEEDVIANATPSQLTTALGTVIDKFSAISVIKASKDVEYDPLTLSLIEEARRLENADKP